MAEHVLILDLWRGADGRWLVASPAFGVQCRPVAGHTVDEVWPVPGDAMGFRVCTHFVRALLGTEMSRVRKLHGIRVRLDGRVESFLGRAE